MGAPLGGGFNRRARRLLRVCPGFSRLDEGRSPLDIGRLVSPLRFDVLVRQSFFEFVDAHPDVHDDPAALARAARGHPYRVWFEAVAVHRIRPGARPPEVEEAFRERIDKTLRLMRSFAERGFDDQYPIVLRTAGPEARTATGKRLAGRLYPSDGCHRLALLRWAGHRSVMPSWYQVRIEPGWEPPDNTATLMSLLGMSPSDYFEFLSLGYGTGVCSDEASLLDHVAAVAPDALEEVRRIVALDAHLLRARRAG